ncbi:CaiB/BaiF CoA transferase family protein [Nocardia nova]|uniref:CaiB/BaiF CoA transferase family protein n=1 Tax=Nocardia nova TaxID=37330 RepID=UPI0033EB3DCC
MPAGPGSAPLSGVRVLSLAQLLPGPYATRLLAELGAEVIMVEQVDGGDPARADPPVFDQVNRGKRSVALDLKTVAGQRTLTQLATGSRVVVEGFRPGVAARLGADYTTLRRYRPDVVYCSISGYGQDAADRLVPGHDLAFQARAGLVGPDTFDPARTGLPIADLASGMYAALAIVAAVLGGPDAAYLDIGMADAVLSWSSLLLQYDWHGLPSPFAGQADPGYGIFATADDPISLSIAHEDAFWERLCGAIGLTHRSGLRSAQRRQRADELRDELQQRLSRRTAAEWLSELTAAGVPVGRVNDARTVLRDPLFETRGMIRQTPDGVEVRTPLSRLDPARTPPPSPLGADNSTLLAPQAD